MKSILLIISSILLSSALMAQQIDSFNYSSNYKLREDRKVGAGLSVGGALGAVGAIVELNIEDDDGAVAGFGTGSGYQTMALSWKHSFEGEYFTPYTTLGLAHWWDNGNSGDISNSSALKNFLSDEEKRSGRFGIELMSGSAGMQFNQLTGELAGSSFFIEFGGLFSLSQSELLPTGSVGALYYF